MDVSLFDYDLPPQSIAQEPAEPRDASKLLVLDRARGTLEDAHFSDLPRWLEPGDCVVVNESRVDAVRRAMDEGRYHVDPQRVADKMLRFEVDLLATIPALGTTLIGVLTALLPEIERVPPRV